MYIFLDSAETTVRRRETFDNCRLRETHFRVAIEFINTIDCTNCNERSFSASGTRLETRPVKDQDVPQKQSVSCLWFATKSWQCHFQDGNVVASGSENDSRASWQVQASQATSAWLSKVRQWKTGKAQSWTPTKRGLLSCRHIRLVGQNHPGTAIIGTRQVPR